MAIESKAVLIFLREAYFAPEMQTARDVNEHNNYADGTQTVSDVAKRLGVGWSTANMMLERGKLISLVRASCNDRNAKNQWPIILPNRMFYALVRQGVFHPDQLFSTIAERGDANKPGEVLAVIETIKAMGKYL